MAEEMIVGREGKQINDYGKIIAVNLKYHFGMHLAAAVAVSVLTLLLFNITALSPQAAAQPIEFMLCWTGMALLTPVFWPERDPVIRDVVRAKRADYLKVCLIRVFYSVLTLIVLNTAFVGLMRVRESQVSLQHVLCAVATAFFLGAVGFAGSGIVDNTVVGYMIALMYYMANYGLKDKLGVFNLFSMYMNGSCREKWWQLAGGIALITVTFAVRRWRDTR